MKLIVTITLLIYSTKVLSFSSVVGYINPEDKDVHTQILYQALKPYGFSYISFSHIVAGNVSHDYYDNNVNKAEYHCDRNRGVNNINAAKACKKAGFYFLKRAEEYVKKAKMLKALHFFGRSLHIFQDFVSHSNYVDLKKSEKEKAFNFITGKSKKVPQSLKITSWDHRAKKDESPGMLKGDFYPHDAFAKDSKNQNKESKIKLKAYKGKTKFEASVQEAVVITAAITGIFKKRIDKKSWQILLLDKHFN